MQNQEDIFVRLFAFGKVLKQRLDQRGLLSFGQFETLRFVEEERSPTMRELAHYQRITAPSATVLVDELVRLALLRRVADKKDRRAIRLELTPKGKRVLRTNTLKRKEVIAELFNTLSQSDRKTFNTILGKLIQL